MLAQILTNLPAVPPLVAGGVNWTALTTMVSVIVGFLTLVATNLFTLLNQKKANAAAVTTAAATTAKLNEVHTLVNSRLGTVLNNYAGTMAALAKATGDPLHQALAAQAQSAAADHASQQLTVDTAAATAAKPPGQ